MPEYAVRTACDVAGTWREKGEIVTMTPDTAMHLAPPYGCVLELLDANPRSIRDVTSRKAKKGHRRDRLERR